jgi:hypothetical protein
MIYDQMNSCDWSFRHCQLSQAIKTHCVSEAESAPQTWEFIAWDVAQYPVLQCQIEALFAEFTCKKM